MNGQQAWLVAGVPGLLVTAALLVGHGRRRAWLAYAVLAALVVLFAFEVGDRASATVIGSMIVVLVASGRGTAEDDRRRRRARQARQTLTRARHGPTNAPAP